MASSTPANCSEVIAVAATTNQGSLAPYSDFGAGIALSAPGGDDDAQFRYGQHCGSVQQRRHGSRVVWVGNWRRHELLGADGGRVASLVLGLAPNLSAAQLRALLTSTASPFPVASNCSTSRCGAGIVNARAAVAAAVGTGLDLNQHGLTGSYYEPATDGQGFEVEIYPDQQGPGAGGVFMSWFTFDTVAGGADRQRWYTLGGQALSGQPSASLTIYRNTGGNFNAPPITNGVAVGTATLSFDTCASGRLSYAFTDGSGRTGTIPLTRITQNVTCSTTGARPTNADFALSGNWYDPATNGQGFSVEVNPNNRAVFIPWYTYAPAGAGAGVAGQRWYTAQGPYTPGSRSIAVDLYETTGGVFDAPTPASNSAKVGSGTLAFQSCSHATMNFNFFAGSSSGSSGPIALIRPGPVPPGCVF